MNIKLEFDRYNTILLNGPVGTRLKYHYKFDLGPNQTTFDLINSKEGLKALHEIYQGDINITQEFDLPMIINAPTYRSSQNYLTQRGFSNAEDVKRINLACLNFGKEIVDRNKSATKLFLSATLGSMKDAYSTEEIPAIGYAQKYHSQQINIFNEFEVDLVYAATLPSLPEALGIVFALEKTQLDYLLGFVLNQNGNLLDQTPLHKAIEIIDQNTTKKPLGYMITCTHTSVILTQLPHALNQHRIMGVQANGANFDLSLRNDLKKAMADPPEQFADDIMALKQKMKLKIIGGCCGTDKSHLKAVSRKVSGVPPPSHHPAP